MINQHYKNRYLKFITVLKNLGPRDLSGYTETHHIIPRCLHGSDNKENLIKLTLREHYLAHWLLWRAYPDYLPLASAFLQMTNKNPKVKTDQGIITSRTYEKLRTNVYKLLATHTKGWVYVKDAQGNVIKMSKAEYENQSELKFHTTGKLHVLDTFENKWAYITSEEYKNNKDRYKSRLGLDNFPHSKNNNINHNASKYVYIDIETNEILKITKKDAREKNKEYGYKRLKNKQNKIVKCLDDDGKIYYVLLSKYNPEIHNCYMKNSVNVFDTIDKVQKIISLDEYKLNSHRYLTSTKGKVLAKDSNGNNVLITKEQFKSGNYVGQTKGLRMVKDLETGEFKQITEDEFFTNRSKYVGPNVGRVNIVEKFTGVRKQIDKSEFDPSIHLALGNRKFLFKCKNKLTNKEKNINIYEWHLVQDQYEIIEYEKYQIALNSK